MLKLKKVAVTGIPGSGKTTVCRFFEQLGAFVVNADAIVHQLLSPSTEVGQKVISLLGKAIVVKGRIDRAVVARLVFGDPALLKKLEEIVHPEVQKELEKQYLQASKQHYPLFIAEIPLLFETGFDRDFAVTIAVVTDEKRQQENRSMPYLEVRRARMLSQDEKRSLADIVIENNGTLEELYRSVQTIFNQLKTS